AGPDRQPAPGLPPITTDQPFAAGQSRPLAAPTADFLTLSRTALPARPRGFDLDIHPGRPRPLVQSVDRLAGGLDDGDQPFVRADFKLLPRLLIDVRAAQHRVTLDPGRERDRTMNDGTRALGRIDNFRRRLVEDRMVVGFHTNADPFLLFTGHSQFPSH